MSRKKGRWTTGNTNNANLVFIATVNILCGGLVGINHLYLRRGNWPFNTFVSGSDFSKHLKQMVEITGEFSIINWFDAKVICNNS